MGLFDDAIDEVRRQARDEREKAEREREAQVEREGRDAAFVDELANLAEEFQDRLAIFGDPTPRWNWAWHGAGVAQRFVDPELGREDRNLRFHEVPLPIPAGLSAGLAEGVAGRSGVCVRYFEKRPFTVREPPRFGDGSAMRSAQHEEGLLRAAHERVLLIARDEEDMQREFEGRLPGSGHELDTELWIYMGMSRPFEGGPQPVSCRLRYGVRGEELRARLADEVANRYFELDTQKAIAVTMAHYLENLRHALDW